MSLLETTLQQKPISVFSLPNDLLSALTAVDAAAQVKVEEEWQQQSLKSVSFDRLDLEEDQALFTCRTCDVHFTPMERDKFRKHYSTDWHRYNIKRKLVLGTVSVSLAVFEDLLAELSDSLSGSGSEEEEEEEEKEEKEEKKEENTPPTQDRVAALVGKQASQLPEEEDYSSVSLFHGHSSALVWFSASPLLSGSLHLGIYRSLLSNTNNTLEALQSRHWTGKQRRWTLLMMGGGHFAGCIVDVNKSKGMADPSVNERVHLITHKTFHRYTTRRRQGGSQSANDNAKGKAKSAGAQIRRYNEQALQQDIRELLSQWRQEIDKSEVILIHAPSNNRKTVYGYDQAILHKEDPRIHSIPFPTRRPTLNELKRVYLEITTLKTMQVDEISLLAQQMKTIEKREKAKQQLERSKQQPTPTPVPLTTKAEGHPELDKLVGLVRQGKTSVVFSYLSRHKHLQVSALLPREIQVQDKGRCPTLLHVASHQGHPSLVEALLREARADPTVQNEAGKTAYDVAKNKTVRNVFRSCMHSMPTAWAWLEEAHVPSPLTPEAEQELLAKEQEKLAKEAERNRQVEEERRLCQEKEEEAVKEKKAQEQVQKRGKANMLIAKALLGPGNTASMSPEARTRLEREKRARAAEERMRRMAGH